MNTIYKPKGKALEYSALALNLYRGCSMSCFYCFAPKATFTDKDIFHNEPEPRKGIIEALRKDAHRFKGKEVLMSFSCDTYQSIEEKLGITREAIKILQANDIAVNILTKGAVLAMRDFDLLRPGIDRFGVSLTFWHEDESLQNEPNAALPSQRMFALEVAKDRGLTTWVSLEPVIAPEQTLRLIKATHKFVDLYKVGKWNYDKRAGMINWKEFLAEVKDVFRTLGVSEDRYYIKEDLKKYE